MSPETGSNWLYMSNTHLSNTNLVISGVFTLDYPVTHTQQKTSMEFTFFITTISCNIKTINGLTRAFTITVLYKFSQLTRFVSCLSQSQAFLQFTTS